MAISGAFSTLKGGPPKVYADPFRNLLQNEDPGGLCFALSRGIRTLEPSAEMGAVRQNMREVWLIFFLLPRTASMSSTEDQADAVFETLQATLAPTIGFRPTADCAPLELQEEDVWARDAVAGTIYYATFENDFWEG